MLNSIRVIALKDTKMGISKNIITKGTLGYGEKYTPDDGIERWNIKWDKGGIGSHKLSDIGEAPQETAKRDRRTKYGKRVAERVRKEEILEKMPRIWFVEDSYNGGYRVGRSDWPGDTFEIVQKDEFDAFYRVMKRLSYPIDDLTHE